MDDKKTPGGLTVKDENIMIYLVDIGPRADDELSEEIQEANNRFEEEAVRPTVISRATPCQCQFPRIHQKAEARAKILGPQAPMPDGRIPIQLDQDDIDTTAFGVVVGATDGKFESIKMIISQCKSCGKLQFWGDLEPVLRMMTAGFTEFEYSRKKGPTPPVSDEYVIEDMDTGERTPAGNLAEALFGKGSTADVSLSDIPDKPDTK